MKVITLISGGDIGGAKTHVLSLLHGLGKTEQVRLVCFREGEFAEDARKLGIDTCVMEVSVGVAIGRLTQMIREEGSIATARARTSPARSFAGRSVCRSSRRSIPITGWTISAGPCTA